MEQISAFSFESFLGAHIKGAVRSGYKPLHQIAQHIELINSQWHIKSEDKPMFTRSVKMIGNKKYFKKMKLKNTSLYAGELGDRNNNIVLTDNSIAIIKAIYSDNGETWIDVQRFRFQTNLFTYPIKSECVGVVRVKSLLDKTSLKFDQNYHCKVMLLPHDQNSYVAMSLSHTL